MEIISNILQKPETDNEILFIGNTEDEISFVNSKIKLFGEGNRLIIERGAEFKDATLSFNGSNSLIIIGKSKRNATIRVNVWNDNTFFLGRNYSFNGAARFILSEQKNLFIGDDNMFSTGVVVRLADPHLIYDGTTRKRINPTKSVYLGDHIWIGQDVMILKGVEVGTGSILGAKSLVAKSLPSNVAAAGSPARVVRKNVFWARPSVHAYTEKETAQSQKFPDGRFVYTSKGSTAKHFAKIEEQLSTATSVEEKTDILTPYLDVISKNRFFLPVPPERKKSFLDRIFSKGSKK
ncbi:transferase hexapeptide (six repeat-containing protein) [Peribacillus simplex]|uniref:Transferase hexapeptide (Six repeat-containing protein) n=1 Tax=Peribacillus simplex TaxID=1478 RepID=A0A9X8WLG5_9BACI|nr:acyltransferase [Peribacillus simplex]SIR68246.1 transferase hexapeptide (six repeat-containing protein) [Peribacillus simplex]